MIDTKLLDDLARNLSKLTPSGIGAIQKDLEHNFRTILQSTFSKLNLVSREEFDVQSEVLARTRAKLEILEKQVKELETK
ncbi:MAG: accessory factor UbiK family protein [Gammaproteobacteria bacterium]|nr:accessory factor UbiK family protein [Gammaproteobacteria bacterium]